MVLLLSIQIWLGVRDGQPVSPRSAFTIPFIKSTWFSRLAAVTSHFYVGGKSKMVGIDDVTNSSLNLGGPRINERHRIAERIGNDDRTLVRRRYRWCGLPVGILRISSHVTGLITLTLASNEFRTNNGVVCDANAELESATKAQKKERNRDERRTHKRPLMNEIVALIPTKASLSLESPNRPNALPSHIHSPGFKDLGNSNAPIVSGGAAPPCYPRQPACV